METSCLLIEMTSARLRDDFRWRESSYTRNSLDACCNCGQRRKEDPRWTALENSESSCVFVLVWLCRFLRDGVKATVLDRS
jgi:hypothetical protein